MKAFKINNRKSSFQRGSSLYEYGIILAILAIALIPVYFLLGQNIIKSLDDFRIGLAKQYSPYDSSTNTSNTDTNNTQPETIPVIKSQTPLSECKDSNCTISFGDFVLQGVPKNLADYVDTNGAAGGTKILSDMFEQIADQLEQQGDAEGSKMYRDLANLGHFTGDLQAKTESAAVSCGTDIACFNNVYKNLGPKDVSLPSNVSGILTNYSNPYFTNNFAFNQADLGTARWDQIKAGMGINTAAFATWKTMYSSYAMLDLYDQIISNSKFSDSLKNVTKELYFNIDQIGYQRSYAAAKLYSSSTYPSKFDPFTGGSGVMPPCTISGTLDDITHPKTSIGTDLSSSLVCVAGKNKTDGTACK